MRRIDVCNGDADGLCAVRQWRLHEPAVSTLVTGLKRDIALLERVRAGEGDEILVCDVSIERNRDALVRLLAAGAHVRWFDHHEPGAPVSHPRLQTCVDTGAEVCSSVLVDRALGGRWRAWAIAGAFGDNLRGVAHALCARAGIGAAPADELRRLGEAINYNAYGDDERDVRVPPAEMHALMARYDDPFELLHAEPVLGEIERQRLDDLARAEAVAPARQSTRATVWILPDAPWSRRVVGCFANELAQRQPQAAHAVLLSLPAGGWRVSLRAPLAGAVGALGAAQLCAGFGGSGRTLAAGIDRLAPEAFDRFVAALTAARWHDGA